MATMRRAGADANGEREELITGLLEIGGKINRLIGMRKRGTGAESDGGDIDARLQAALDAVGQCTKRALNGPDVRTVYRTTKPQKELSVLEQAEAEVDGTRQEIPPEFWELARQVDELYQIAIAQGGEGADA